MNPYLRDRALLPIAIPVGAFAFIALVAVGFSRILLRVPKEVAVAIALMTALNLLIAGAVLALRPRLRTPQALTLLGAAAVPLLLGGAVAAGIFEFEGGKDGGEAPPVVIEVKAANIAFAVSEIKLPAGQAATLRFDNADAGISHNVSIFQGADAAAPNVFRGEIFAGPRTVDYRVPPLEAGTYFFQCDVHPTAMTGLLVVSGEAPAEAGEAKPVATSASIGAAKIAFTKKALELPAGAESVIEFANGDSGIPHNVAIYQGADAAAPNVFRGEIFPGPRTVRYRVPPLEVGTYYFQCDVHPTTMTGTLKVR